MAPWKRKYRKAKRRPLRILSTRCRELYGCGYIEFLEDQGLITRNTFYDKFKRRTLDNEIADKISELFKIKTSDWYPGKKDTEPTPEQLPEDFEDINFDELEDLL